MPNANPSRVAENLYRDERGFLARVYIRGVRKWRRLKARTKREAVKELAAKVSQAEQAKLGLARDPWFSESLTIGELIEDYKKAGMPKNDRQPRKGTNAKQVEEFIEKLTPFWKNKRPDTIEVGDLERYHERRRKEVREGCSGGRSVDIELATLSSVLNFAQRTGRIAVNPIRHDRPRFQDRTTIKRSRSRMPATAKALHNTAYALFERPNSEPLGFQLLLEAFTGIRTSEALALRWDAEPYQPGHIDGDHLWLHRAKEGVNPFALIHEPLRRLLDIMRTWNLENASDCPYFIAGRDKLGPAAPHSLTHALRSLPGSYTSHSMRAYFVTVRRSQGIGDAQIAAEIGDRTGAAIIADTYGAVPPNWQGRKGMDWLPPNGSAAWEVLGIREKVLVTLGDQ